MKKHGKSIGCLLLLALLLCGCRASSPSQEGAEIAEEATLEDIERVVTEEMESLLGANPGITP